MGTSCSRDSWTPCCPHVSEATYSFSARSVQRAFLRDHHRDVVATPAEVTVQNAGDDARMVGCAGLDRPSRSQCGAEAVGEHDDQSIAAGRG